MDGLCAKILAQIFLHVDSLEELLRISYTCRQWRAIIVESNFLQERFTRRRHRHLLGHWKFEDAADLGHNSSQRTISGRYSMTGQLQQETCFLGLCLVFDAHSSITIPLNDCQSEQFCVSVWILNASSVHSWRTVLDIILFGSKKCGFHLGITPLSTIESQLSLSSTHSPVKCRSRHVCLVRHLWYHIVVLVSKHRQQLFINGRLEREVQRNEKKNDNVCLPMNELNIGTDSSSYHCWFGRIADVSVWNCWLDPMEIRAIWQQRVPVDRVNLGEYMTNNLNKKQSNTFRSVLL